MQQANTSGLVAAASRSSSTLGAPSPVEQAQNALESSVSILHGRIGLLAERLTPVLGPNHPAAVADKATQGNFHVPVADALDSVDMRVQAMARTVDDLLDRLGV